MNFSGFFPHPQARKSHLFSRSLARNLTSKQTFPNSQVLYRSPSRWRIPYRVITLSFQSYQPGEGPVQSAREEEEVTQSLPALGWFSAMLASSNTCGRRPGAPSLACPPKRSSLSGFLPSSEVLAKDNGQIDDN